jgi:tRNA (adenine22-N1)-methyltransferase
VTGAPIVGERVGSVTALGPRLRAVMAALPSRVSSVADVGAGDGQLAAALARRGLRVIATEAGAEPYARLRRLVPGGSVECRLGDGLAPVGRGEVEAAVLAGMGGGTIVDVLERDESTVAGLDWLVLQPQQRAHQLETWLDERGFRIRRGEWAMQGHRPYRVLLVEPPA